jgi:tRNA pseudouridine55 synthase
MNGFLIIDKPGGITSHDVVGKVRHILHERRVGHTGTLDPFATGVLIVMVGRATRLAQFLSGQDKHYDAIIRLGYATDTGDRTGTPIAPASSVSDRQWTEDDIEAALAGLRGEINQTPPMYSAKKIGGKKLYEMARRGEVVEREPVRVCIHEFAPIRPDGQLMKDNRDGTLDFYARVVCSAGTYVRTLAEDFGKRLGIGAHVAELRRTQVGSFNIESAITLDQLKTSFAEESLGTVLHSPGAALSFMTFVHLSDDDARRVRHGVAVKVAEVPWADGENIRLCESRGTLIGIGQYDISKAELRPRVILADEEHVKSSEENKH